MERYRIIESLEVSAFVERSLVEHTVTGRRMTLTRVRDQVNPSVRASIIDTVTRVARVAHPHVMAIVDADLDAGWYVTDAYAEGTVWDRVSSGEAEAIPMIRWCAQLASGTAALHAARGLHRGISPARMELTPTDEMRLGGFGIVAASLVYDGALHAFDPECSDFLPESVLRDPQSYDGAAEGYAVGDLVRWLLEHIGASDLPQPVSTALARLTERDAPSNECLDALASALLAWSRRLEASTERSPARTSPPPETGPVQVPDLHHSDPTGTVVGHIHVLTIPDPGVALRVRSKLERYAPLFSR